MVANSELNDKKDDFFLYNDEEQQVSRNYLSFLHERFAAASLSSASENDLTALNNGSKMIERSSSNKKLTMLNELTITTQLFSQTGSLKYDNFIIKAKIYILEILEVFNFYIYEISVV